MYNIVYQPNKLLKHVIRQDGSYFMVLLYLYQKYANLAFSPEQINRLHTKCVQEELITEDCFINFAKTPKIFGWFSAEGSRKVNGEWVTNLSDLSIPPEELGYNSPTDYVLLFQRRMGMKKYYHFVVGNKNGKVLFDPIPHSKTVEYGTIKSYRLFKIKVV